MKTTVALLALVAATQMAHAQSLRPSTAGGALLGGIAGAVIGNNSGHDSWKGAAIGAVAGGLLGSAYGNRSSYDVPMTTYRSGYGRDYGYYSPSVSRYRTPSYYDSYNDRELGYYGSTYSPYESRRTRASTGLILGGIAGAIIGNNSGDLHHNAWRGAAIGSASGWLLGSIADQRARERARRGEVRYVYTAPEPETPAAPQQTTVPQTVIINNNYYGTSSPMSSANALFGR